MPLLLNSCIIVARSKNGKALDKGIGMDWGVLFTRIDLAYLSNVAQGVRGFEENKRCQILEPRHKSLIGQCTWFGSCRKGAIQYFGYFCQGLKVGEDCVVETTDYREKEGRCTNRGDCVTSERVIRFRHEDCLTFSEDPEVKKSNDMQEDVQIGHDKTQGLISPQEVSSDKRDLRPAEMNFWEYMEYKKTQEKEKLQKAEEQKNSFIIERESNSSKQATPEITSANCKGIYNPPVFTHLQRICRDCFNMYKEPEVFPLCSQDCFGSKYFMHCAKALLVKESKAKSRVNIVGKK